MCTGPAEPPEGSLASPLGQAAFEIFTRPVWTQEADRLAPMGAGLPSHQHPTARGQAAPMRSPSPTNSTFDVCTHDALMLEAIWPTCLAPMGAGLSCHQHPCARALGSRQEEAERCPSGRQPLKLAPVTGSRLPGTHGCRPGPARPVFLGVPGLHPGLGARRRRREGRCQEPDAEAPGVGLGRPGRRVPWVPWPAGCWCASACGVWGCRSHERDFDLADALDGPDPTKKPGTGNYPDLQPYRPQPGSPDSGGDVYPRPKPPPARPQPGHPEGGGSGGHSNYGDQQGNTVAKVVSPIVSVVVVTLVGAAVSYYNRRRGCCVRGEPENV
ncbi:glycoprotein Xg [Erinaceus europaeus]|uniref:Glycoprotein Xg n=1 Tax=Erinaceus europaeus TaxID=9365 RepID=A0ABM3WRC8_ERIEU|nr:glycoprotein Xg [Erinaceus europaeus]